MIGCGKVKRKITWCVAAVAAVLVVLAGGEPASPQWEGEDRLYWSGSAGRSPEGYVPVRMHGVDAGRGLTSAGVESDEAGLATDSWLEAGRKNASGVMTAPPPIDYRFSNKRDDDEDWLSRETDQPGAGDSRSGWGWLADEVLQKRSEARAARREAGTQSRGARGMGQVDPYAELYK